MKREQAANAEEKQRGTTPAPKKNKGIQVVARAGETKPAGGEPAGEGKPTGQTGEKLAEGVAPGTAGGEGRKSDGKEITGQGRRPDGGETAGGEGRKPDGGETAGQSRRADGGETAGGEGRKSDGKEITGQGRRPDGRETAGQNSGNKQGTQGGPLAAVGPALGEKRTALETVSLWLFPLLLFSAMTVQTGRMSVVLSLLAIALSIGKTPLRNLRQALSLPVIGLVCYAVLNGFAAIYSPFGDYAAREFAKILASFAVAVIVLTRFRKPQARGLLWGFSGVCAAISLLCVDMAGEGPLFRGFANLMERLGSSYAELAVGDAYATRLNGIFNNGNLSASLLALGILAALYLVLSGKKPWERLAACLLLGVNAMGFFLSMSRGAILSFAVAALVYLVFSGKGNRLPLFFLMVFTAIPTVGLSALCMGILDQSLRTLGLTLLCGGVIFVLDWAVGRRLAARLEGHGKAIAAVVLVFAVASVGYAVAAVNVTGPYTFGEDGGLYRATALPAGDYTLEAQGADGATIRIYTKTQKDILLGGTLELYQGPLAEAAFTVPEDAERVFFNFVGAAGDRLDSVTLSDGTALKLGYPLLPDFVENRLQDSLWTSNSLLLRWQFMKDGLMLFAHAPILGHGLGSSEGLLTSVQPFFYESLYIHNHLIQAMDDMGLLGLAALLTTMLGAAWLLIRRLRRANDSLAAMLLACLVMMNLHGLMEITFSVRMYQCAAWTLVAAIALLYAENGGGAWSDKAKVLQKYAPWAVLAAIWLYLAVFSGLYVSHMKVQREIGEFSTTDVTELLDTCADFVKGDVFDHEQAQLTYVGNALLLDSSSYNGDMLRYVRELRDSGTYTACSGLAQYYYLPKGDLKNLFIVSREGIAQEASSADAWNLQFDFYRETVLPAVTTRQMGIFMGGILETRNDLKQYNAGRLEEIVLSEENQAFVQAIEEVRTVDMPDDAAQIYLMNLAGNAAG